MPTDLNTVRSALAAAPARLAARQRGESAAQVGGGEHAALHRPEQVAALLQRLLGVDAERGAGEAGVVGLAHRRREAADQVGGGCRRAATFPRSSGSVASVATLMTSAAAAACSRSSLAAASDAASPSARARASASTARRAQTVTRSIGRTAR